MFLPEAFDSSGGDDLKALVRQSSRIASAFDVGKVEMEHSRGLSDIAAGYSRRTALKFVVLLGIVSLFADMTYEGARSITGPYIATLGASALAVGLIAGFGELVGYALRLVSGYLADKTGRYWGITIFGYALNLLSVPLLALTGRWEFAAGLMITERVGKAIRTPARDAMLSHGTKEIGHGWGFGFHEAMDQTGAVIGPLSVAAVITSGLGYHRAFGVLVIPALAAIVVLINARRLYPHPRDLEAAEEAPHGSHASGSLRLYIVGASLIAAGYADFPLIAYHFGKQAVMPAAWVPGLYAFAMGIDGVAALMFGYLFDRKGISVLIGSAVLSALFAPLVFMGGFWAAVVGMALWGIGMGAQESILRPAIATLVPPERRGSAYGLFNSAYGIAWFLGSTLMGYLYEISIGGLIAFSVLVQLVAIPLFIVVAKQISGAAFRAS
jgi:MFS family permease